MIPSFEQRLGGFSRMYRAEGDSDGGAAAERADSAAVDAANNSFGTGGYSGTWNGDGSLGGPGSEYSFDRTGYAGLGLKGYVDPATGRIAGNPTATTWGYDPTNAMIVGNVQDAAKALGVAPSQLNANMGGSWLASLIPGLAPLNWGIGKLQDNFGLPGYIMSAAERAQADADRAARGGYGSGNQGMANQLATYFGYNNGSNPNIVDQITNALNHDVGNSAQTSWDQWLNNDQPWLTGRRDATAANADASSTALRGLATGAFDDYNNTFRPAYQKFASSVYQLGDPEYMAQQRAQAMEGVQGQWDQQMGALTRQYAGMGVGSGALQDALAANASKLAMAKVAAATNSDNTLRQTYQSGLKDLSGLGLQVGTLGNTASTTAGNITDQANTFGLNVAKMSPTVAQTVGSIQDSHTNAAANTVAAKNGTMNAQTAKSNSDNSLMNTLLGVGASAGLKWLMG